MVDVGHYCTISPSKRRICMRKHIYIIIATSLLLGDYVYATDIHYLMKDLRNQRVVSEDLVVIAKEAFKNKHQEYGSAKKLYSEAKRKYNTYVDDLLFALQFEELRSLNDSAIEAKEKADLFEEYVRKEAQTLSIGPFIAQFGDTIVNSVKAVSEEIRAWSEYNQKRKKQMAEQLGKLLKWKIWENIK